MRIQIPTHHSSSNSLQRWRALSGEPEDGWARVVWVRHGQGIHQALGGQRHRDAMLTKMGVSQARDVGRTLSNSGAEFDAVVVSPLLRAVQTAGIALENCGGAVKHLASSAILNLVCGAPLECLVPLAKFLVLGQHGQN